MTSYIGENLVTVFVLAGRQHVFDQTNIVKATIIGVDAALREAAEMLASAIVLKPLADAACNAAEIRAYEAYWSDAVAVPVKKSASHFKLWRHGVQEFFEALLVKEFLTLLIKSLSMNHIPRLRQLAGQTLSGERNARAGEGFTQPKLPEFPKLPPPHVTQAGIR